MAKAPPALKQLQRRLRRLARLDGCVVHTLAGPFLVSLDHVSDPERVVASFRERGGLEYSALVESMQHGASPQPLTVRTLASAQRDVRRLQAVTNWLELVRSAPRLFARIANFGPGWLDSRQAQIDRCALALGAPAASGYWFDGVLGLVESLHGRVARKRLEQVTAASMRLGGARRDSLRQRLDDLVVLVRSGAEGEASEQVRTITTLMRLRRRGWRRRLLRAVAVFLGVTAHEDITAVSPVEARGDDDHASLILGIGKQLLAHVPTTRSPAYVRSLHHVIACYGLMFRVGKLEVVTPEQVTLLTRRLEDGATQFAGLPVTLAEVVLLLRVSAPNAAAVRRLLVAGLSSSRVLALADIDCLREAARLANDGRKLAAYSDWVCRLTPHYARLGVKLELDEDTFGALYSGARRGRKTDLPLLAHCLIQHHRGTSAESIHRQVANLDSTVALFRHAPTIATTLMATITGTSAGLGRATHRQFADWLEEDELLDRYLHLLIVTGASPSISNALLQDFERTRRMERELLYLAGQPRLSADQERRLDTIKAAPLGGPGRTKRRLTSRIPDLAARAYGVTLDALLRELLRDICGVQLGHITPAWRDAVRFYLTVTENRDLLASLLRFAATKPGISAASSTQQNRTWSARAQKHLDVTGWLSPRSAAVTIADRPCVISIETDPLQVLRMGIPFGTCLSLDDGCNAASTVVVAMDVNKHVVYLKSDDDQGKVLGRKLVAISDDWKMLGYCVYSAIGDSDNRVTQAIDGFCLELAADLGVDVTTSGQPQQLHRGFWYDDGTRPFAGATVATDEFTEAYCTALGRSKPAVYNDSLAGEARNDAAVQTGDVGLALAQQHRQHRRGGLASERVDAWLLAKLGRDKMIARAARDDHTGAILLRQLARDSFEDALSVAVRLDQFGWQTTETLVNLIARAPSSPAVAELVIEAAHRSMSRNRDYSDHGLEHNAPLCVPRHLERAPMHVLLGCADRLDGLLDFIVTKDSQCTQCRAVAEERLLVAAARSFSATPRPKDVVKCLLARRHSGLAHRIAVRLAATFSLAPRSTDAAPTIALSERYTQPPVSCPSVVRALLRCARERPQLRTNPDLYAALVRHVPPQGTRARFLDALPRRDESPANELARPQVIGPALRALELAVQGLPSPDLGAAMTVVLNGCDDLLQDVLCMIFDGPHELSAPSVTFVEASLTRRASASQLLDPAWFPRIWRHESLRQPLVANLSAQVWSGRYGDTVMEAIDIARLPELACAFLASQADDDGELEFVPRNPDEARLLAAELATKLTGEQWVTLYRAVPDFLTASILLDALAGSELQASAKAVLSAAAVDDYNEREPLLRQWLDEL